MTALILSLILSLLFLIVILFASSPWPEKRTEEVRTAELALADALSLSAIFYPRVEVLFGRSDYDYLLRIGARRIAKEFQRERRATALRWLRQLRTDVHRLLSFHWRLKQAGIESSLRTNLYLLGNATLFYLVHSLLYLSVWALGPYALPRARVLLAGKPKAIFEVLERLSAQASPTVLETICAEQRGKYLLGES